MLTRDVELVTYRTRAAPPVEALHFRIESVVDETFVDDPQRNLAAYFARIGCTSPE